MQADAHVSAATIDSPKLNMSADGRCDLPEHCALYCIVTFMQVVTSLIFATEVVKVCVVRIQGKTFQAMMVLYRKHLAFDVRKSQKVLLLHQCLLVILCQSGKQC